MSDKENLVSSSNTPVISIIGRPNVGKSSIFNRLMGKQHKAITHDIAGVTRDRHYGLCQWNEGEDYATDLIFVDTGGFFPEETIKDDSEMRKEDVFYRNMQSHARMAIRESDFVLFVVDGREGMIPTDEIIGEILHRENKPFIVVVNKIDTFKQEGHEFDFYALGIDEEQLYTVSAAHGRGFTSLKERIDLMIENIKKEQGESEAQKQNVQNAIAPMYDVVSRVAIIGAPNAGKSTLLNKLLGAERALVTNIAGTTVDPIDGYFTLNFGQDAQKLEQRKKNVLNDRLLLAEYDRLKKIHPDLFTDQVLVASDLEVEANTEVDSESDSEKEEIEDIELTSDSQTDLAGVTSEHELSGWEEGEELSAESSDGDSLGVSDKSVLSTLRSIHLVDTAGIRKQSHVKEFVESQSVYRALRCITESDVVIYLVDSTKGITHQDRRLLDIAHEKGKSIIIGLNKFDLLSETLADSNDRKEWMEDIRYTIPWLDFCQLVPFSAKFGDGVNRLKRNLKETVLIREQKVPTSELNYVVRELVDRHPIVVQKAGGVRFKVKYASLVKKDPPTFLLFSNRSKGIPTNYTKYLKNNLRAHFGYKNTPVHLIFRSGKDLETKQKKTKR